ncbi:TPA: lamin tail domain-containing protein, partial [Candidatus Poribacteria bacterium]|nr:lamin tail domain-containing protein [Candidatus Poribacteria bacterium]
MVRVSLASLMVVSVILPISVWGDWTNHVIISEIQADSVSGSGGTLDDWIELYNPTDQPVDLTNWRIEKTQKASDPKILIRIGNTNDGSFPGGTAIPPHGFYLIVRDDANETLKSMADAIGTRDEFFFTGSVYTIYLATGAVDSPDDPDIVDT